LLVDPTGARGFARDWHMQGGGEGAAQCEALAQLSLGEADAAAEALERIAVRSEAGIAARAAVFGQAAEAWRAAGKPQRAAAAAVQVLKSEINWNSLEEKAQRFEDRFRQHPELIEIRRVGMMFAFDMVSAERVERVVSRCMEKGLITFWFLSHPYSFRLSPPLTITEDELNLAADLILQAIEETRVD
jgi:4-aminobutyrate aminotransferase-like enzyme